MVHEDRLALDVGEDVAEANRTVAFPEPAAREEDKAGLWRGLIWIFCSHAHRPAIANQSCRARLGAGGRRLSLQAGTVPGTGSDSPRCDPMIKKIIVIAGPNGAGKTTFARSFLPEEAQCPRFINADLIAAGLAPFAPETAALKAGRLMLEEIADCVGKGESFAFETTLSGLSYLNHIKRWRAEGYHVSLFFLTLPDAETAIARVAERVRQGGHDIPESVIRRRFAAGLRNLEDAYKSVVDTWAKYDNVGERPELLEWGENE